MRAGLADVISIHELLTNQILLFNVEKVRTTPWLQCCRLTIWLDRLVDFDKNLYLYLLWVLLESLEATPTLFISGSMRRSYATALALCKALLCYASIVGKTIIIPSIMLAGYTCTVCVSDIDTDSVILHRRLLQGIDGRS